MSRHHSWRHSPGLENNLWISLSQLSNVSQNNFQTFLTAVSTVNFGRKLDVKASASPLNLSDLFILEMPDRNVSQPHDPPCPLTKFSKTIAILSFVCAGDFMFSYFAAISP